jgi:hypothetical protein
MAWITRVKRLPRYGHFAARVYFYYVGTASTGSIFKRQVGCTMFWISAIVGFATYGYFTYKSLMLRIGSIIRYTIYGYLACAVCVYFVLGILGQQVTQADFVGIVCLHCIGNGATYVGFSSLWPSHFNLAGRR